MIGIIGAMDEEVSVIVEELIDVKIVEEASLIFHLGKLNNKDVVVVKSGIGKVNSALATTLLIKNFGVNLVYFCGVGGGLSSDLSIGDVVVSTYVIHHDFDATAFGYELGVIPRDEVSKYKAIDTNLSVKKGIIVSGDQFINDQKLKLDLAKNFNAICVDMESAGVAQICSKFDVEFLIIRSISDTINDDAKVEYSEFINIACKNSKNVIINLV